MKRRRGRTTLACGAIAGAVVPTLAMLVSFSAAAADQPAAGITAPIPAGKGRVLAEKPGGTVTGRTEKRKKVRLQDGQEVTFVESTSNRLDEMKAIVLVDGEKVTLPYEAVLTEARMHRPPIHRLKADWAIFATVEECGDICHGSSYLLGPGIRARLGEDTDLPDPTEAVRGRLLWRADGRQVVVEGREAIAVASLPDGHFHRLEFCHSVAYAPDGRLFLRGDCNDVEGNADGVFEVLPSGELGWITGWPGKEELDPNASDDSPKPVSFLADGTLVAHFQRPSSKQIDVRIPRAQIGSRPEDLRAGAAVKAISSIAHWTIEPPAAATLVRSLVGKTDGGWTREVASAANTGGYQLYQDGNADAALPLFEAAADLDPTYGMPRYNAARVWARRGDAEAAVRWLQQLKAMGSAQRARLAEARKDEGFKKIWSTPTFASLGI